MRDAPAKKPNRLPVVIVLVVFAAIILFGIWQTSNETPEIEPTQTPEKAAWYACTLFIQRQLDLSIMDAQDYTPSGVTALEENHYQVQVHYAKQGSTHRCELFRHENGNMELLGLEVR